jgi:putative transposase
MPQYRRPWLAGSYFVTIVTYHRRRLFTNETTVERWRKALAQTKREWPFDVNAAVVLPDHVHLIVTLPTNDGELSKRIGRAKALFTKRYREVKTASAPSPARRRQREADLWQRRFYDHWIRDESEYEGCFDYVHYNPVHHGRVSRPIDWPWSSFHHWLHQRVYDPGRGRSIDMQRLQWVQPHAAE